jgi:predicted 3-demethylubiquinone-9 3-methyltransferase (glyoxalase superfamily)
MHKITPFLWFNGQVEAAMNFYTGIFKHARIGNVMRGPDGGVMSATFELEGQPFMALNGGPMFTFSPAVSFFVHCETQAEVDEYWDKLGAGGKHKQCGWLEDPFGLSWQIIPSVLGPLLHDKDRAKANRVMQAMMQMTKLDIKALQQASQAMP